MEQNSQLIWSPYQNFRNAAKQYVHNTEYVELEPTNKSDTLYEFELAGNDPICFGVACGFRVEGSFQTKKAPTPATQAVPNPPAPVWETFSAENAKTVTVMQNWLDHYMKTDIFHVNNLVNSHDMPPNVLPYVNDFIAAHLHKDIKKILCMEDCHPMNATTVDKNDWKAPAADPDVVNSWTRYAPSNCKDKISFLYTPLSKFPMFQDKDYCFGPDGGFNYLPIQNLGRMHIRVFLKEDSSSIFHIPAAETAKFRFNLTKLTIVYKELRLAPSVYRQMASYKGTHLYRGLSFLGLCENGSSANFTHRMTVPNLDFPEGIFIMCLDKKIISGTSKATELSIDGPYLEHHITSVDLHWNGNHFFTKVPNAGTLDAFQLQRDNFAKMHKRGPFGIKMDPDLLTFTRQGLSKDLAYPNVWIDFTESGPHTRIQTVQTDQNYSTNRLGDLTIILNFKPPRAANDGTYCVICYYTDHCTIMDMKLKKIGATYNKSKTLN